MWINLDDTDMKVFEDIANGGSIVNSRKAIKALHSRITDKKAEQADLQAYRDAVETDDELKVDADAVVSPGDDPGAWVMAWIWITNEQAGIETGDEEESEEAA